MKESNNSAQSQQRHIFRTHHPAHRPFVLFVPSSHKFPFILPQHGTHLARPAACDCACLSHRNAQPCSVAHWIFVIVEGKHVITRFCRPLCYDEAHNHFIDCRVLHRIRHEQAFLRSKIMIAAIGSKRAANYSIDPLPGLRGNLLLVPSRGSSEGYLLTWNLLKTGLPAQSMS